MLYNEEGRQVGAIESLRNVTEIKVAENSLRESEARFRAVFTQSSVGMVRADQLGFLKEVNAAFATLVGRPAEALQGMAIRDLTHPEDWPREQSVMRGMLERGESSCRMEKRYIRPDGNEVWADVSVFTVHPTETASVLLIGMATDITENKRVQLALLASEERYRAFLANSTECIWRFELDHPVSTNLPIEEQIEQLLQYAYLAECNDATARMYNYDRAEEMIGLRWKDLAGDDPRNLGLIDALIRSGYRMVEAESFERDRDGNPRRFMNSMVGVVENDHVVRAWGVQRDITEQERAEEALREANFVIENSPVVLFRWRATEGWPVVMVSNNVGQFGYSAEELLSGEVLFASMVHPEDLDRVGREVKKYSESGAERFQQEYRIVTKDGQGTLDR